MASQWTVVNKSAVVRSGVSIKSSQTHSILKGTQCELLERQRGRLHVRFLHEGQSAQGWVTEVLTNGTVLLAPVLALTDDQTDDQTDPSPSFLTEAERQTLVSQHGVIEMRSLSKSFCCPLAHPKSDHEWGANLRYLAHCGALAHIKSQQALRGHAQFTQDILSKDYQAKTQWFSALTYACHQGHFECAAFLLEHGSPPRQGNIGTALIWAVHAPGLSDAQYKDREEDIAAFAHTLMKTHHVSPDRMDIKANTALGFAAQRGSDRIAKLLLEAKADPLLSGGVLPAAVAAKKGHSSTAKIILAAQREEEAKLDTARQDPLACLPHVMISLDAQELGVTGTDFVNYLTRQGYRAHVMYSHDSADAVRVSRVCQVFIPLINPSYAKSGQSVFESNVVLRHFLVSGSPRVLPVLMSPETFSAEDIAHDDSLSVAYGLICQEDPVLFTGSARRLAEEVATRLKAMDVQPDRIGLAPNTETGEVEPAAKEGESQDASCTPEPQESTSDGNAADDVVALDFLTEAELRNIRRSYPSSMPLDPSPRTDKVWAANLRFLARNGVFNHLQRLLAIRGPGDLEVPNRFNETALVLACKYGHQECAAALLRAGANVNHKANGGNALLWACRCYSERMFKERETALVGLVAYLLEVMKVDPNCSDNKAITPLHNAAWRNSLTLCRLLLASGADPEAKNKGGATPADLTSSDEVRALLTSGLQEDDVVKVRPEVVIGAALGSSALAQELCDCLSELEISAWFADLSAVDSATQMDALVAVSQAQVFVPLIDLEWTKSELCQKQFQVGLRNNTALYNLEIIPAIVDCDSWGAWGLIETDLPEVHALLCSTNAVVQSTEKMAVVVREHVQQFFLSKAGSPSKPMVHANTLEQFENKDYSVCDVMISLQCSSMGRVAVALQRVLQQNGISVWLCMDALLGGDEFREQIVLAAKKSRVVIQLLNDAWAKSGECRYEFLVAKASSQRFGSPQLLPVLATPLDLSLERATEKYPLIASLLAATPPVVWEQLQELEVAGGGEGEDEQMMQQRNFQAILARLSDLLPT